MRDNGERAMDAETAVDAFMKVCGTDREDAIPDLICNLCHLAEQDGDDAIATVTRALHHFYAETHGEGEAEIDIIIKPIPSSREPSVKKKMRKLLKEIAAVQVNGNSEPDVMSATLDKIVKDAAAFLEKHPGGVDPR